MPDKPKLIYSWNYLSWGGAQIYFLGLAKSVRHHFDIHLVIPTESDPQIVSFFKKQQATVHFFDPSFDGQEESGILAKFAMHRLKIESEKAMLRKIEEVADGGRAIIHAELAPWQSIFSLVWLLLRFPVFITMHNSVADSNAIRKAVWKLKMRVVSRWDNFNPFTSNEDTKAFFRGYFSKVVSERTVVTYTSADLIEVSEALGRQLDSRALKNQHGLPSGKKIVMALGQFIDRKGRWEFVEAAKKLSSGRQDFHFVWVSNLKLTGKDREKLDRYEVSDCFSLLSSNDVAEEHVDLFEFLRIADVFVLPSHVEGLPISILEAMALGLPVISTRINAIPEAVTDGENGVLVEPKDAASLAAAINKLLDKPELREQYGAAGQSVVTDRFSEEAVGKLALREYLKVLDG